MMQQPKQPEQNKFKEIKDAYEKVFSTPQGKKVMEDIKKSGKINISTFDHDPYVSARNEGIRTLALNIVQMAEPQPETKPSQKATT